LVDCPIYEGHFIQRPEIVENAIGVGWWNIFGGWKKINNNKNKITIVKIRLSGGGANIYIGEAKSPKPPKYTYGKRPNCILFP